MQVLHKGFQGVSIDEIVAETGYTKGAFYHQFPTKLELGYALVEEIITPLILSRWIVPLKESKNPLDGILEQIQTLIGKESLEKLKLGCPLNNLVQEMSPIDKGFKLRLEKALNLWVDEMDAQLQRGQKENFVKKSVNTKDAAQFVVMVHEGFYGTIKGMTNKSVFESLFNSLKIYLDQLRA